MYDIIFIGHDTEFSDIAYKRLLEKFPNSKRVNYTGDMQETFNKAVSRSFTQLFWIVWDDVIISDDFKFDYQVPEWDKQYIHVFLNGSSYDGICIFSKKTYVSKRELEYRFFTNKKEIPIAASRPSKYEKFNITSYEDYQHALEKSTTEMFWIIPNEVEPLLDFEFDNYFSWHNSYERKLNHVFKNQDVEEIKYNGIMLMSKQKPVAKREIDYRFLVEKKEYDIVASKLKLYDIVFISYNEPNADENFAKLKEKYPRAQRVHGVKGIHQAHIAAAKLSSTPMFWVVDGDALIEEDFKFDLLLPKYNRDMVHVWRSRNPINDLEYGYGGVKLLPTDLTINVDVNSPDMTTSISKKFKVVETVSNVTSFNTDPFNTWKSAFRECAKLASKTIDGQVDVETTSRLKIWCAVGKDRKYGKYAVAGALAGRAYGETNAGDKPALSKINDFDWLLEQFNQSQILESLETLS